MAENMLSEIGKPDSGCTADFTSDGQEPLNPAFRIPKQISRRFMRTMGDTKL
ncbi:hypothetical protein KTH81_21180 [Lachnospiraceae bacterium ASD3451]|nr:hypothetical protein [Diplocloster agilis]